MQLVLITGFGTALTGTSRTLDFLTSFSDGSDGFSGSDFSTGLDGFSGFFRTCSGFRLDWIGLVFQDFFRIRSDTSVGFSGSGFRFRFFQWFGTVGCFKDRIWFVQRIKEKMKLTDIGLWKFDGYWIKNFVVSDTGFDCFVSINFDIKINLYTYPQQ